MALLETRGVSKRFAGLVAVSDVSIAIEAAEIFGVIGPNGAGKTTLFNVVSGQNSASSGQVLLDGKDITGLSIDQIASRGLVRTFQRSLPFETMSLLENVLAASYAFGGSSFSDIMRRWLGLGGDDPAIVEQAHHLLRLAGLGPRAHEFAGALSHGDRRRLEIARAMMCKPRLLLLDEPAAGLSGAETRQLTELLRTLRAQGQTVVIIEHNLSMVMSVCDRIAVLNRGVKIAQGTPAEIQQDEQVIEAYLGRRTREHA